MRTPKILFWALAGLLVIAAGAVIYVLVPSISGKDRTISQPAYTIGFGTDTVKAKVLDILEEGTITLGEVTQQYQILLVKLQEGPHNGQLLEIDYGQRQIRPPGLDIQPGDLLLVTVGVQPDGSLSGYFTDFVRAKPLMWLLGVFVLTTILISGWKGVRSLAGLAFSLVVIIGYIIPQILQGRDPVLVSISGAFVLLAVILYLTYGWRGKTHAAVLGTLIALVITGLISDFFVDLTRLTGFSSEDALFLVQQADVQINLRGLTLGGMLIGALGVLDDLVITQASAVFELFHGDPLQTVKQVYTRAMRIGRDHVAATVNTLVLAYAGAALPMLLLFSLSGEQYNYLVNLEFVAEEIVRTLVGSLGLMLSVPITTALACFLAARVPHSRVSEQPESTHLHTH